MITIRGWWGKPLPFNYLWKRTRQVASPHVSGEGLIVVCFGGIKMLIHALRTNYKAWKTVEVYRLQVICSWCLAPSRSSLKAVSFLFKTIFYIWPETQCSRHFFTVMWCITNKSNNQICLFLNIHFLRLFFTSSDTCVVVWWDKVVSVTACLWSGSLTSVAFVKFPPHTFREMICFFCFLTECFKWLINSSQTACAPTKFASALCNSRLRSKTNSEKDKTSTSFWNHSLVVFYFLPPHT